MYAARETPTTADAFGDATNVIEVDDVTFREMTAAVSTEVASNVFRTVDHPPDGEDVPWGNVSVVPPVLYAAPITYAPAVAVPAVVDTVPPEPRVAPVWFPLRNVTALPELLRSTRTVTAAGTVFRPVTVIVPVPVTPDAEKQLKSSDDD